MIQFRTPIAATLVSALVLAGCTTGNFDESDPHANAKTGAILGALTGAVAGGLVAGGDSGERGRATAAAAVLGAAIGASIGSELDAQEAELRDQLGNDTQIQNTGDRLILTMPQDILFATDSAVLRPTLVSDLRTVGQSLLSYPDTTVQIVGHTDNTGTAAYNLDLSERRAGTVTDILISEGVPAYRLRAIGEGEDQPVASNLTPEGRAQNRRVEIVILPNG